MGEAVDDLPIHPDWDAELFKTSQWVVVEPSAGKHTFYFQPNGTVVMVTDSDNQRTKRVFAHKNGQWVKENIDG